MQVVCTKFNVNLLRNVESTNRISCTPFSGFSGSNACLPTLCKVEMHWIKKKKSFSFIFHHHHVPELLCVFPVPWSSRWSWSLHLFLGRLFGLYCSACFSSLFVSILCTCCSHSFWYCFISFTMFCAPVFCLIHWLFSLSMQLKLQRKGEGAGESPAP